MIPAREGRAAGTDGALRQGVGTSVLHDSPLEETVTSELVSENGIVGAWRIPPDSRGFLDDKRA